MKLLIEIGVEELPAIPFLKELDNIPKKWEDVLKKQNLYSEFSFFYTPRRMVILHNDFKDRSDDETIEIIGAPKDVAFKDDKITKAGESFLQKAGIKEEEITYKIINNKEVLYHQKIKKGQKSEELLPKMIEEFLNSLSFGKSMRWGDNKFEFIRPIRNLICSLDDKNVECELFGIKSAMEFYPHRDKGFEKIAFNTIDEYFKKLDEFGVILDQEKRKEIILDGIKKIEEKNNLAVQIDEDLLSEVVAITEYPSSLLGEFDEEFLSLPQEVIITSMKENQRYFAVFNKGKLSNHFVVVSNSMSEDKTLIIKGNQKVLRARLADAMFFYESDLKAEFDGEALRDIIYLKELGSIFDKELRELTIANKFYDLFRDELLDELPKDILEDSIADTIILSKADLSSSMVGEFPELQGIIGGYYARAKNYNDFVVSAIKEQYLPQDDDMPNSLFSALINISMKLETLMSLFSIDKIPTGTKDPYALRRNAIGIIKIVVDKKLSFDLKELIDSLMIEYKKFDANKLLDFIKDRLFSYEINPSIIKACIQSKSNNILRLVNSMQALDKIAKEDNFKENFSTFKRLANIIKNNNIGSVDINLFENESEVKLNDSFNSLILDTNKPYEYLKSLFGLKESIDNFFDSVLINVEDNNLKQNRLNLIGQIYKAFLKVADIKEISI